jgi:hypothetical protein
MSIHSPGIIYFYGGIDMEKVKIGNSINKLEQEIIRKERLAFDAKKKGMHATYGNYLTDISVLKNELNRLTTSSNT